MKIYSHTTSGGKSVFFVGTNNPKKVISVTHNGVKLAKSNRKDIYAIDLKNYKVIKPDWKSITCKGREIDVEY